MLPGPELLESLRDMSDEELCNALLWGLKVLRDGSNDPAAMREFIVTFINTIRLAEAGRVAVRDEGAN